VHLISPGLDGGNGINNTESTILVTMPVEPNAAALFVNNLLDETNHRMRAVGG
jgi:hypothetical protein